MTAPRSCSAASSWDRTAPAIPHSALRIPHSGRSAFRLPRSAFTLVELVVVLAILGITAAAVVPAFARLARGEALTRTARELERVLEGARSTSLARAVTTRVTFLPATGRYWTSLESGADAAVLDSGVVALGDGVRFASPTERPSLRFDALGVADGDSLLVLGPTGALALVVDRWTGEVSLAPR